MKTTQIIRNIMTRYEKMHKVNHYFGLLAYFALSKLATDTKDEELIQKCIHELSGYQNRTDHPQFNFENYYFGGDAKAWMIYHGYMQDELELFREYAEKTLHAPCDRDGILCMARDPEKEKIWIDVVYAVVPFMLFAGLTLKEDKYIEFAAQQCIKMYRIFLDPEYGVLHQSRGFCEDKEAFSEDHWSRENGLHGLLDRCLDKEFATYKSCPGCLCPAVGDEKGTIRAYVEGKQPEKDEEHSYGSLMLAFYEACKNGIEDLPAPQNESL